MHSLLSGWKAELIRWLGLVVVASTFLLGATSFLPWQCLWGDETTQLCGLGLGPSSVCRWLTGAERHDFGQFPDRMPPASYWAGWAWGRVFGAGEAPMRWFGVACVALASMLIHEGARKGFGAPAGWAAGLLFATSPGIVVMAVEIRAYPLFLLLSAAAFYQLVRLAQFESDDGRQPSRSPRGLLLATLTVTLAAAMATHFHGFALAGAVQVALASLAWRRRWPVAPLVGSVGVLAIAALGLWPYVKAAKSLTHVEGSISLTTRLETIYKLLPNLIDHPSLMVYWPVEACVLAGAVLLVGLSLRSRSEANRAIATALGAGLGAVAMVELLFARPNFQVCAPHYNVWSRPALCLVAAAGLAGGGLWERRLAAVTSILVIAAQGVGIIELAAHGDHFAHGPHRTIAAIIGDLGSRDLVVIHDDAGKFPFTANPIRYEFGPGLEQFRLLEAPAATMVGPLQGDPSPRALSSLTHRYVVLVRPTLTGDKELARQVRSGDRPIGAGPIYRGGGLLEGRRHVRREQHVAFIAARIDVFERTSR